MSSTTLANGRLLPGLIAALFLMGCAQSRSGKVYERTPLSGPPRAILRVPPILRRGRNFQIELALVGNPRHENLQRPIAIHLSILDGRSAQSIVTWGDPRVSRYYKWVVPANITRELRYPYVTIHVAVHHFTGYTLTGRPLVAPAFLWTARVVKVQHPVANSGVSFGIHQAEIYD